MFTDVGDVTDIVIAGFDSVVDLMLKVKISVIGHPKIPCMRLIELLRISTGSQELNFSRGHLFSISMNSVLSGLSFHLFVNIQS